MKIKTTYTGFTNIINIGMHAFFIEVDNAGVEIDVKELVKQSIHFNRVVIKGKEPFKEREDLQKLVKSVTTANPNVQFEIHTTGTVHPLGIGQFNNIIYNIFVKLKNSGETYKDRIKPEIINWFNTMNGNFIFKISNNDEFDESFSIISDMGIKKSRVFLMPNQYTVKLILEKAKYYGYNFTMPLEIEQNE